MRSPPRGLLLSQKKKGKKTEPITAPRPPSSSSGNKNPLTLAAAQRRWQVSTDASLWLSQLFFSPPHPPLRTATPSAPAPPPPPPSSPQSRECPVQLGSVRVDLRRSPSLPLTGRHVCTTAQFTYIPRLNHPRLWRKSIFSAAPWPPGAPHPASTLPRTRTLKKPVSCSHGETCPA